MPQAFSGPGGRWYARPATGVSYPSVTTFLDVIAKPFLLPWAAKVTAEYVADNLMDLYRLDYDVRVKAVKDKYEQIRMEAADQGTAVHEYADDYITTGFLPYPPTTHSHESVVEVLDLLQPNVVFSEATVCNETLGYMGTLDGIWEVMGERWLIDWKSGKRIWPDYGLQVLAYERAHVVCADDEGHEYPMPSIDRKVLIHCPQEGPWTMSEVITDDEDWATVEAAHNLFLWKQGRAKEVLGPPQTAVMMLGIVKVAEAMMRGSDK